VSELLLFLVEPFGRQGSVGEERPSAESDKSSDSSLDDEEPSPSGHPSSTIELEDTGGDQACKSSGEDVSWMSKASFTLEKGDSPVYKMAIRVATSVRV